MEPGSGVEEPLIGSKAVLGELTSLTSAFSPEAYFLDLLELRLAHRLVELALELARHLAHARERASAPSPSS